MATDSAQKDWNAVLNALAGTTNLDAQGAANAWAGLTGSAKRELVGALNNKNGSSGLGLNAVCNQLAGLSVYNGLDALGALNHLLAHPTPGGADAMVLITDTLLGADAATFDFTSIPATHKALELICDLQSNNGSADGLGVKLNNDATAANYVHEYLTGIGAAAAASAAQASETFLYFPNVVMGNTNGSGKLSSALRLTIPNYASTTFNKNVLMLGGGNDVTGADQIVMSQAGMWISTVAVNRITLLPAFGTLFKAGSRVSLYGID